MGLLLELICRYDWIGVGIGDLVCVVGECYGCCCCLCCVDVVGVYYYCCNFLVGVDWGGVVVVVI